jgi:hypothetical protein
MIIIGRSAYRSLACPRGSRLSIGISTALHILKAYSTVKHDHREHVERSEFPAIPLGELENRIRGERDGVEEDQDDDEAVDDATHRMDIAADLEHIMNLAPQAPIGGCRAHDQARPARRLVSRLSDAVVAAGASA